MPKFKLVIQTLAALSLGAHAVTVPAAGDPERGKQTAQVCLACHGPDGAGMSAANYPRLDILDAGYMAKQLRDIKAGTRQAPIMQPFAATLTDQQIEDVSAYYASQSATVPQPPEADPELMALGRKLVYRGDWDRYIPSCNSCHGPESRGVGSEFPALAGQHASYIESQLRAWKDGTRHNDPLDLMLAIAERMTDEDIKAAAAFLAAQPAE